MKDDRQVRVPEEADRAAARVERAQRVVAVEDVVVLVERRAVADLDVVVDGLGPAGSSRRYSRLSGVSVSSVQTAATRATWLKLLPSSMPQAALSWLPRMTASGSSARMRSTTSFGSRAVADEVAEHEQLVPVAGSRVEHGVERLDVRVNVRR